MLKLSRLDSFGSFPHEQVFLNPNCLSVDSLIDLLNNNKETNFLSMMSRELDLENFLGRDEGKDKVIHVLNYISEFREDVHLYLNDSWRDIIVGSVISGNEDALELFQNLCRYDEKLAKTVSTLVDHINFDDLGLIFAYSIRFMDECFIRMMPLILSSFSTIGISAVLYASATILYQDSECKSRIEHIIWDQISALILIHDKNVTLGVLEVLDKLDLSCRYSDIGCYVYESMVNYSEAIVIGAKIIAEAGSEWREIGYTTAHYLLSIEDRNYKIDIATMKILFVFFDIEISNESYPSILNILFKLISDPIEGNNAIKLMMRILMKNNECYIYFDEVIDDLINISEQQNWPVANLLLEYLSYIQQNI